MKIEGTIERSWLPVSLQGSWDCLPSRTWKVRESGNGNGLVGACLPSGEELSAPLSQKNLNSPLLHRSQKSFFDKGAGNHTEFS